MSSATLSFPPLRKSHAVSGPVLNRSSHGQKLPNFSAYTSPRATHSPYGFAYSDKYYSLLKDICAPDPSTNHLRALEFSFDFPQTTLLF